MCVGSILVLVSAKFGRCTFSRALAVLNGMNEHVRILYFDVTILGMCGAEGLCIHHGIGVVSQQSTHLSYRSRFPINFFGFILLNNFPHCAF